MSRVYIFLLLLLPLIGSAFAQTPVAAPEAFGNQPIEVSADRLEADEMNHYLKFFGNVVARQGDLIIYGQELALFYTGESREIDRVEVVGDVRIVQATRVATGQKGVFHNREGKVVLTGSPRVRQGDDFVEGEEITVFLHDERSIVTGKDGARVNAIFHPKKEGQ